MAYREILNKFRLTEKQQSGLFIFLNLCGFAAAVYLLWKVPIPGIAIAIIAVMAAAMSLFPDANGLQKTFGMIIICLLLIVELRSIRSDRKGSEAAHSRDLGEQREHFNETLYTYTGGNSFPQFNFVVPIQYSATKTFNSFDLIVINDGKYSLHDVIAEIQRVRPGNSQAELEKQIKSLHVISGARGTILPGAWETQEAFGAGRYAIGTSAANGSFSEMLEAVFCDGRWDFAAKVKDGNGKVLFNDTGRAGCHKPL